MFTKNLLQTSVQYIKGVGPRRAKILQKLGIFNIVDLLYHFPHRYEDRSCFMHIRNLKIGQAQTVTGKVVTGGLRYTRRGPAIFQAIISDETGSLLATWFNQPYLRDKFTAGSDVILYGKVEFGKTGQMQILNPEYEFISEDEADATVHTGRVVPIYPLTAQISQRQLRTVIYGAVDLYSDDIAEILPSSLRRRLKLPHVSAALKNIHFPQNRDTYRHARKRLIFDEFFLLETLNAYRKKKIKKTLQGISHKKKPELKSLFSEILPFTLTASQQEVLADIEKDMFAAPPMYRLLQGDVGSGKTVVALYALLLSVLNGYQTALMAPTEILAEQHFRLISKMLEDTPYKIILVKGKLTKKAREKVYHKIESGTADIIIGTHSLVQEGVKFKKLGLCVIDEQHKFGVLQRKIFREKGRNADILVMTATPIPRTLAMALYADMDVSVIRELPLGRKPITTWWITEKKRTDAYNFIKKEIKDGKKQAYIVYPLVEESEKIDLRDATKMYEHLKKDVFRDFKVGLIHGKLPAKEKQEIMRRFKKGEINILVSTIVIEVGIDVPDASVMLIEHAERFGLAQLHQLRGRVGRGSFKSYCILVSNARTEDAKKRMRAMVKSADGFEIAEQDLKIRGPGDVFGLRQHGFMEFKIADPLRDAEILEAARREAFNLIEDEKLLNSDECAPLSEYVRQRLDLDFV